MPFSASAMRTRAAADEMAASYSFIGGSYRNNDYRNKYFDEV
jgi:hypothetical protein